MQRRAQPLLLQVATAEYCGVLDCLLLPQPLLRSVAQQLLQKRLVVHAGDTDLQLLRRLALEQEDDGECMLYEARQQQQQQQQQLGSGEASPSVTDAPTPPPPSPTPMLDVFDTQVDG